MYDITVCLSTNRLHALVYITVFISIRPLKDQSCLFCLCLCCIVFMYDITVCLSINRLNAIALSTPEKLIINDISTCLKCQPLAGGEWHAEYQTRNVAATVNTIYHLL